MTNVSVPTVTVTLVVALTDSRKELVSVRLDETLGTIEPLTRQSGERVEIGMVTAVFVAIESFIAKALIPHVGQAQAEEVND